MKLLRSFIKVHIHGKFNILSTDGIRQVAPDGEGGSEITYSDGDFRFVDESPEEIGNLMHEEVE